MLVNEITKLRTEIIHLRNEINRLKGYSVETDLDKILLATSEVTGVEFNAIKGKTRHAEVVTARHLALYIMRNKFGKTSIELGKYFVRDHSTIFHAINKVELYLSMPQFYKKENEYLNQILAKL
jgi:chromosomal replication initiator protein